MAIWARDHSVPTPKATRYGGVKREKEKEKTRGCPLGAQHPVFTFPVVEKPVLRWSKRKNAGMSRKFSQNVGAAAGEFETSTGRTIQILFFLSVFTVNPEASGVPFRSCFSSRKNSWIYFYLFLPPVVSTFCKKVKRESKSSCFYFLFLLP